MPTSVIRGGGTEDSSLSEMISTMEMKRLNVDVYYY
jgi:hypothetical protein